MQAFATRVVDSQVPSIEAFLVPSSMNYLLPTKERTLPTFIFLCPFIHSISTLHDLLIFYTSLKPYESYGLQIHMIECIRPRFGSPRSHNQTQGLSRHRGSWPIPAGRSSSEFAPDGPFRHGAQHSRQQQTFPRWH